VSPSPVARLVDDPSAARRALCRSLGLPEDTLIVGASGRLTRLKSPETFIEVAARVAAAAIAQQMAFVWLGAGDVAACQQHAADRGLANVHFIGAAADPAPFFAAIDLFVVVSVTDAFPLVALEAAQAGAPVVCFGDTGGIGEFVRDDAGVVIPTRDVGRMAEVVVRLAGNPAERGRLGATAARRVATSYRPDVTAGRLWDIVVGEREPRLTGES
jgi:glycosyltransferase involved in cell wall biosynthesis